MPVVQVFDFGPDLEWRKDDGVSEAVPFGDGLALLQPRVVPVTDERTGELLAEVEVSIVNGKPGVTAIRGRDRALTSTLLRSIPSLHEIVRGVAREATVRLVRDGRRVIGERYVEAESSNMGRLSVELDSDLSEVLRQERRRRVLDDEFLARVAEVYRQALSAGISTQRAVQEQLGPISDAGARRWIQHARRAGFLGKSLGPWRAGESPSPGSGAGGQ